MVGMRASAIETQIARAVRQGASPAEVGALAAELAAQAVTKATTKRKRPTKDRGAEGTVGQVQRSARALLRRLEDDPTGVGAAAVAILAVGEEVRDAVVRELRAGGEHSWPQIAAIVDVPVRTAIRRWGPEGADYPGGLPEGGQVACRR
jgi:hypothetical protein